MEVPPPRRDGTHGVRSSSETSRICSWRVLRWLLVPALALLIIASSVYSVILVTKEKPKIIINETQYREGIVLDLQADSSYSHIPDKPGVLDPPTNNKITDTNTTKIEEQNKMSKNETQNASSTTKSQSQDEDGLLESLIGSFMPVSVGNNDQNGVKEFGVSLGESGYRHVPNSHQSGELLQQQGKLSKNFEKSTTVLPVSPTLPSLHQAKGSAETTQSPLNITNSDCFSPQLSMCRGVVPWDLTTLPSRRLLPGLQSSQDLQDALPYFELVLESGCSPRTQDFLCSLLEPECRPEYMSTLPPCRNVCRAVAEECGDFILDMLDLSKVFQCANYPDSDDPAICVNLAKDLEPPKEEIKEEETDDSYTVVVLEPAKKEIKEEETDDSYTEESLEMEVSEVKEESEVTVYGEPLKKELPEVNEEAPCSEDLLQEWTVYIIEDAFEGILSSGSDESRGIPYLAGNSAGLVDPLALSEDRRFCCHHCGFRSAVFNILKEHILAREGNDCPASCPDCTFSCAQSSSLRAHIRIIHADSRVFFCPHCNYRCKYSRLLKKHIEARHECKRPYSCPQCDYTSSQSSNLKTHIETRHEGKRPYSCPQCDYTSSQYSTLKKHIDARHEGKRPYSCPQCDYTSSQSSTLKKHIETRHEGKRPYSCPQCDYTSARSSTLKVHIETRHEGKRPYSCPQCDYTSSLSFNLKSHIEARHEGKRPYSCPQCDYTSSQSSNLKRHIETRHEAKRPYSCSQFDYTSAWSFNL